MRVPVAQTLGAVFSVDDLTGFEITKAIELPEPYGIIALWGLVLPAIFIFANAITQLAFKDALILKVTPPAGPCGWAQSCTRSRGRAVSPLGDMLTAACCS